MVRSEPGHFNLIQGFSFADSIPHQLAVVFYSHVKNNLPDVMEKGNGKNLLRVLRKYPAREHPCRAGDIDRVLPKFQQQIAPQLKFL
ncbi:MAG: hypothetical protein A4E62_03033 [Syntrophorhabdus sp. PtaU1.Bin002]|nr:MAG: hypothetical protein A4E62_03033 [Syntrophorhabdus sp. PtaU1.Bin002]